MHAQERLTAAAAAAAAVRRRLGSAAGQPPGQLLLPLLVVERGWAKLGGTDGAAGTGDGWGAG
eukprot:COSAG06_NODE_57713_length_279_cov_0.894444_1_plen_62_part_10